MLTAVPSLALASLGWACAGALVVALSRAHHRLVLVARASHELRGPLSAARLGLQLAGGEPGRIAVVDLELVRAGRALDDLAAAPAGGRASERPTLVDLAALADAYAPAWRTLAAAHGAGFRLELPATIAPAAGAAGEPPATIAPAAGAAGEPPASVPPTAVFCDPLRIVQACANLVANAAEHGGGIVRVRIRALGDSVRVEVSDDGPGLPAPVADLAAEARRHQGRRGHGLAIAAAIAERNGGRLAAAPARRGARLCLELPAAQPARNPAAARPPVVA